jgi:hypothetical protein
MYVSVIERGRERRRKEIEPGPKKRLEAAKPMVQQGREECM